MVETDGSFKAQSPDDPLQVFSAGLGVQARLRDRLSGEQRDILGAAWPLDAASAYEAEVAGAAVAAAIVSELLAPRR